MAKVMRAIMKPTSRTMAIVQRRRAVRPPCICANCCGVMPTPQIVPEPTALQSEIPKRVRTHEPSLTASVLLVRFLQVRLRNRCDNKFHQVGSDHHLRDGK